MSNDLALNATVRALVAAFVAAEADVRAAFAAIVDAEKRVNAVFTMKGQRSVRVDASYGGHHDNFADPDRTIERMTRAAWQCIVERLELRRFMSIKRYEELENHLSDDKLPAITEENVTAFARTHLAGMRSHLKEAVDEVFEWLRPRRYDRVGKLKTNTEMEVGAKVILSGVINSDGWPSKFRVSHYRQQHLIALENVFNALDGQGEICKGYQSLLQTAIEASADGTGETSLFVFRACQNGNVHLTFRRLDLLKRLNMLAGGARLRPAESEEGRLRREIAKARAENERLRRSAVSA